MTTVREIFDDVAAMHRRGDSMFMIRNYIIDAGRESGLWPVNEHTGYHFAEFTFPNDEVIAFDGTGWHHRQLAR